MTRYISLQGLYDLDNTIFEKMVLPNGLDKNVFINNLLEQSYEFEVLYPNPMYMKNMLEQYSLMKLPQWQRMYNIMTKEYNALENAQLVEEVTTNTTGNTTGNNASNANNINKVTGYDSVNAVPSGENESTSNDSYTNNSTGKSTVKSERHGSIGVVTPQSMLQQELQVCMHNVMTYIIDDILQKFTIMLY